MDVTLEEKSTYDRKMTISVEADKVERLLDQEIQRLAGTVRLPGFRPGKVPKKLMESRFRSHLTASVAEQLFQETYVKALNERKLRPVDNPSLELGELVRGKPFSYSASFQLFPQLEPQGYTGLQLTRMVAEVGDTDVDGVLEQMRKDKGTFEAEEGRQAATGDQVLLDFVGSIDGTPFDGGSAQGHALTLGAGQFIPGFEEQLVGVSAKEERDVVVTFPEGYQAAHLAGKQATFKCTIHEVRRMVPAELDEKLAEAAGVTEGGVEKLREEVRNNLQATVKQNAEQRIRNEIMEKILAANRQEMPSQLVARERESMLNRIRNDYKQKGLDVDKMGLTDEQLEGAFDRSPEDRVNLALVMNAITTKEGLTVEEAEVDAHIDEITAQFGDQAGPMKKWFKENQDQLEGIRAMLMENKVVAWITGQGEVTEQTCTVADLSGNRA